MTKTSDTISARIPQWITLGAFILAIALMLVRATVTEALHDPWQVNPGAQILPRSVGPAGGVGLDLLFCVPALLVLSRRLLDRTYLLRRSWSFLPLLLLCILMAASPTWAADRFAAAVSASHWIAACALLWAMSQLVRSWMRLRFVAAICIALLAILAARGLYYRLVEMPDLIKDWQSHGRIEYLKQHGLKADSFEAGQIDKKVRAGEAFGFNNSPNTFGAILVMLAIIGGGVIVQRLVELNEGDLRRNAVPAAVVTGVVVVLAFWALKYTDSKAAAAAPVLGALILLAVWQLREWLAEHSVCAYWATFSAVVLALLAAVGHGIYHHSLPGVSLSFRWNYWVGAARIFRHHPLRGVGWDNFSQYYLQYRLPQAPEEVKDPHCFIVRFFVELGAIGGLLMLAWMMRLWWELTRSVEPPLPTARATGHAARSAPRDGRGQTAKSAAPGASPRISGALKWAIAIGCLYFIISLLTSVDFSLIGAFIELSVLERLAYTALIVVVTALIALRSLETAANDERAAPWILFAMLAAGGVFLVQNLVDFGLFETGGMFAFMLIVGAALGVRQPPERAKGKSTGDSGGAATGTRGAAPGDVHRHTPAVAAAFAAGLVAWLVAAGFFWAPTVFAEHSANAADDAIRDRRLIDASRFMVDAREQQPLNADYAFRVARIAIMQGEPIEELRPLFQIAIDRNPRSELYPLILAEAEKANGHDANRIKEDYSRALTLNPNDVAVRLEYAAALAKMNGPGDRTSARMQYEEALRLNGLFAQNEPKRLPQSEVERIQREIEKLK